MAQSQSGRRSAPPFRASSVDANVEGLKNSNTHQRIAKAIFFSFDALSSRTLKLKLEKAPLGPSLFSSSMPPPESGSPLIIKLILVGFAVFNRRVMQLASRGECDRARAGSSLVDFEGSFFFFFCIFGKSYARGRRETKKIITVAYFRVERLYHFKVPEMVKIAEK